MNIFHCCILKGNNEHPNKDKKNSFWIIICHNNLRDFYQIFYLLYIYYWCNIKSMLSKEDQVMMETMYWWGIPTLFRCKNDPDPKNCDIALVGVSHSTGYGTTERDQHLGPRAVRHISAGL